MRRTLRLAFFSTLFALFSACSGGGDPADSFDLSQDIVGNWELANYEYISKADPTRRMSPFDFVGTEHGDIVLRFGSDGSYLWDRLNHEGDGDDQGSYSVLDDLLTVEADGATLEYQVQESQGQIFLEAEDCLEVDLLGNGNPEPTRCVAALERI